MRTLLTMIAPLHCCHVLAVRALLAEALERLGKLKADLPAAQKD